MICSFKEKFNPIINTYTFKYIYSDSYYHCDLKNDYNHGWQCTLMYYRKSYDTLTVNLTSTNEFGEYKETFQIFQNDVG